MFKKIFFILDGAALAVAFYNSNYVHVAEGINLYPGMELNLS